jgi:Uma2 family endonuclease
MTQEATRAVKPTSTDPVAANGHAPIGREELLIAQQPPLESGDRLTRAQFERRYSARPDIKKAELIEGVVYVASPVRVRQHGLPHLFTNTWIGVYCAATPGVLASDNSTLRLDEDNEPQPDVALWIDPQAGGRARITEDDYLEGAPELIVEIAASTAAYDLHDKRHAYRRNGVQEYLVMLPYEQQTIWYCWQEGQYIELLPDDQGIIRSQVFPGLWFHPARFWAGDLAGVLAVLQQGLQTPEHAVFVEQLANAQRTS